MLRRSTYPARLLVLAAALALAACDDAGTGPTSYVQEVSGGAWVAVTEPQGMARPDTWTAWLPAQGPAAARVRELRDEAGRARRAGRVLESLRLEDEAMLMAAGSLARTPDPMRVLVPLAALDAWTDRARGRLETGRYPALAAAVAAVSAEADAARDAMAAGDSLKAVGHLARGTVAARAQSPLGVGVRMLAAVEARLGAPRAQESANLRRARRLLAGAREGLATGESMRALRRAVYALQLLEAEGIAVPPPAETIDSPPGRG
jgi:hypothetical protein